MILLGMGLRPPLSCKPEKNPPPNFDLRAIALIYVASLAEVFGTVIVSCAPGMFSFWFHIVTPSKFYSSLRSRLMSRKSPLSSSKDGNGEIVLKGVRLHVSSSLRDAHGPYDALADDAFQPGGKIR